MGGCCSSITDILRGIMNAIGPLVTIALLCFAAYALLINPAGALAFIEGISWMPAIVTGMSPTVLGYIALGAALIVSPDTVVGIASNVAETIGKVAGTVVAAVTGGLVSGLFGGTSTSTVLGYAALAIAAYFVLTADKPEKEKRTEEEVSRGITPPKSRGTEVVNLDKGAFV